MGSDRVGSNAIAIGTHHTQFLSCPVKTMQHCKHDQKNTHTRRSRAQTRTRLTTSSLRTALASTVSPRSTSERPSDRAAVAEEATRATRRETHSEREIAWRSRSRAGRATIPAKSLDGIRTIRTTSSLTTATESSAWRLASSGSSPPLRLRRRLRRFAGETRLRPRFLAGQSRFWKCFSL